MADIADSINNIVQNEGNNLMTMSQRAQAKSGATDFNQYTSALGAEAAFQQGALPVIQATANIMQRGQQINQAQQQIQLQTMAEKTRQDLAGLQMQDHQLGLNDAKTLSQLQSQAFKLDPLSPTYDTDLTQVLSQGDMFTSQGNVGRLALGNTLMDNKAALTAQAAKATLDRERLTAKAQNDTVKANFLKEANKYPGFDPESALVRDPQTNALVFDPFVAHSVLNKYKAENPIAPPPGSVPTSTTITGPGGTKTTYVPKDQVKPVPETEAQKAARGDLGGVNQQLKAATDKLFGGKVTDPNDVDELKSTISDLQGQKEKLSGVLGLPYKAPQIDEKQVATIQAITKTISEIDGAAESDKENWFGYSGDPVGTLQAKAILPADKFQEFQAAKSKITRKNILLDYKAQLRKGMAEPTTASTPQAVQEPQAAPVTDTTPTAPATPAPTGETTTFTSQKEAAQKIYDDYQEAVRPKNGGRGKDEAAAKAKANELLKQYGMQIP